ncbi:MAG: hypothetical protein FD153_602 [Rhodospirillaceae bacterium]|nr:MAG: hypothetical protein FD153_602 [Rhodospirillaceae bacterium]
MIRGKLLNIKPMVDDEIAAAALHYAAVEMRATAREVPRRAEVLNSIADLMADIARSMMKGSVPEMIH